MKLVVVAGLMPLLAQAQGANSPSISVALAPSKDAYPQLTTVLQHYEAGHSAAASTGLSRLSHAAEAALDLSKLVAQIMRGPAGLAADILPKPLLLA